MLLIWHTPELLKSMLLEDTLPTYDLSEIIVDLVIILIISVGISIWIFFDARRRGINPKPWIILTLLIWVLGLVGYLAFRRQFLRQISTNRSTSPEHSNEALQGALLLQRNLPNGINRKNQKNKKFCGHCGASIQRQATHCPICGFSDLNP